MIVQQWVLLVGCWRYPDRRVVKAAQGLQAHAFPLAAMIDTVDGLGRAVGVVARCLAAGGRLNTRKTAPATAQLLLALDLDGLA